MTKLELDDFRHTKASMTFINIDNPSNIVEGIEALIDIPLFGNAYPKVEILTNEREYKRLAKNGLWKATADLGRLGELEVKDAIIDPASWYIYGHKIEFRVEIFSTDITINNKRTDVQGEDIKPPVKTVFFHISRNEELNLTKELSVQLSNSLTAKIKNLEFENNSMKKSHQLKILKLVSVIELETSQEQINDLMRDNIPLEVQSLIDLITLCTGIKTTCIGWHMPTEEGYQDRFFNRAPSNKERFHPLIPSHKTEEFLSNSFNCYLETPYRETIRKVIYGLAFHEEISVDKTFYIIFSLFESLVLFYKKDTDTHIMNKKTWKKFEKEIRNEVINKIECYIDDSLQTPVTDEQKDRIKAKLPELRRDSLDKVCEQFLNSMHVYREDLWPIIGEDKLQLGLAQIRNIIAHGDTLPEGSFANLYVANAHLEHLIKRVILSFLGGNFVQVSNSSTFSIIQLEKTHPLADNILAISKPYS